MIVLRWEVIASHQVDNIFLELIPAEAVENNHRHLVANKVGSTRHSFSNSLCLRNHSYA